MIARTLPYGGARPAVARPAARSNAKLILRIDGAALKRGHTRPGELCEIDGLGHVPVASIREFLPDAAIAVVIQDGQNVFNVTNFARRANARQQIVLDLLNIGCTRLGCAATDNLQIDHRHDWHKLKVTELENLDWLCALCRCRHKRHYGDCGIMPTGVALAA